MSKKDNMLVWPAAKNMPTRILKNNFISKLIGESEEVESDTANAGLIAAEVEVSARWEIVMKSEGCHHVEIGDEAMLRPGFAPIYLFSFDGDKYAVFTENDAIGAW